MINIRVFVIQVEYDNNYILILALITQHRTPICVGKVKSKMRFSEDEFTVYELALWLKP